MCDRYVLTVEPQLIEKYIAPGQVKLVFRDVLNHGERSVRASEAAACAGKQGKFWEMHDALYVNQTQTWNTRNQDLVPYLEGLAEKISGLDQVAFSQCMSNRETLAAIQAADAEQRTRGIRTQPVFEIGTQRVFGMQSLDALSKWIDAARGGN